MPAQDKAEKNRILAEWLGIEQFQTYYWNLTGISVAVNGVSKFAPNFYENEAANALLLEHMDRPVLYKRQATWYVADGDVLSHATDRKTAICEAALALIQSREGNSSGLTPPTPVGGNIESSKKNVNEGQQR